MNYNTHRPNRTVSASGAAEEPLPSSVPCDEDHLLTPRNHRAEQLAAELERRPDTDNPQPR